MPDAPEQGRNCLNNYQDDPESYQNMQWEQVADYDQDDTKDNHASSRNFSPHWTKPTASL
jgi:hypothetical protein